MGERPKVLILEDDMMVARSLRDVLSPLGYEVTGIAATVTDAIRPAENIRPHLAIVDVKLAGDRDGIEGAMLLRERFGVRAIFLTAKGDQVTAQRAAAVDPAGFLIKPVKSQDLIQVLHSAATNIQRSSD